jgi:hypothetical protein
MASGGYGRGGRGAALLQALSQPARKPGDNGQDSTEKVKFPPKNKIDELHISMYNCIV